MPDNVHEIDFAPKGVSRPRMWRLDGPDNDGLIWLAWEGAGPAERLNLGQADQVVEALADFLARIDFGES